MWSRKPSLALDFMRAINGDCVAAEVPFPRSATPYLKMEFGGDNVTFLADSLGRLDTRLPVGTYLLPVLLYGL